MQSVRRVASASLPTQYGNFTMFVYDTAEHKEHVALVVGALSGSEPMLTRLHSECLTGDVFGSRRCDCGEQLAESQRLLQAAGRGVLVYLRQEGRGIGLTNKIRAYAIQEQGFDTVEANLALGLPEDSRDYGEAAAILRDLDVQRIRLITNNPAKIDGLRRHGIDVIARQPLALPPCRENVSYMRTKRDKMGHLLPPGMLDMSDDQLAASAGYD